MIGQLISRYRVTEKLGEGGMGIVYLVDDTELDRQVALKFLSADCTADPEISDRFRREAKAIAALNHPNIITIHDVGMHEDRCFIALEYVQGQSLKDLIDSGDLPMDEIIDIACQISSGLAEAHRAGIVHRDIKPANILMHQDGRVKIADFGLAHLKGVSGLTGESSTLGTLNYMSPEQIRSAHVDNRSDIFSAGVVLYEMITDHLPFKGDYKAAVTYSILNKEPEPLARYKADVSLGLQNIIDKALDKDPETRYQHVEDMLADLKREKKSESGMAAAAGVIPKPRGKRTVLLLAGAAVIIVALVVFIIVFLTWQQGIRTMAKHRQVTFNGEVYLNNQWGTLDISSISPDGQFIAYAIPKDGLNSIMVQDLTGGQPVEILDRASMVRFIQWSPNNSQVLCGVSASEHGARSTGMYIIPRLGGKPQKLLSHVLGTWSQDGSQIVSVQADYSSIAFHSALTGDSLNAVKLSGFSWLLDLDWSPQGDRLVFLTLDESQLKPAIWTVRIDGTDQSKLLEEVGEYYSPRWSNDGDAVYYLRKNGETKDLMKIHVSPADGTPDGEPEIIQTGFQATGFSISNDNTTLAYTRLVAYSNLWLVSPGGYGNTEKTESIQLTHGTSNISRPEISPDGNSIAFIMQGKVFTLPIEGGEMQQLTYLESEIYAMCWSPSGKNIAFIADGKIWRMPVSGGSPRRFEETETSTELTWAPGPDILYQTPDLENIQILNSKSGEERSLLNETADRVVWGPHYSPDGKEIAVFWNRKREEGPGLWRISLDVTSTTLISNGILYPIQWSQDGKWLYAWKFLEKSSIDILMFPVQGGEPTIVVELPFVGVEEPYGVAMTTDARRIVCNVQTRIADVWIVENFDPHVE